MNKLIICDNSWLEVAKRLGITQKDGFEKFLERLKEESADRRNSCMTNFDYLTNLVTFLNSVEIQFDLINYNSYLYIDNLEDLNEKVFNNQLSEYEVVTYILNGMINDMYEVLDEDDRYGMDEKFLKDTLLFLTSISIEIDTPSFQTHAKRKE